MPAFLSICLDCGFHLQGKPEDMNSSQICKQGTDKYESFGKCVMICAERLSNSNLPSVVVAPPAPPPPPPPLPASSFAKNVVPCYLAELKTVLKNRAKKVEAASEAGKLTEVSEVVQHLKKIVPIEKTKDVRRTTRATSRRARK